MAKRPPLYTGEENSKHFNFVIDDDNFDEHTHGFVLATTAADTQKCIKSIGFGRWTHLRRCWVTFGRCCLHS